VWTDPLALDPTRRATAVTRDLAENLAKVAASLERGGHDAVMHHVEKTDDGAYAG